jgi:hypothetical protein
MGVRRAVRIPIGRAFTTSEAPLDVISMSLQHGDRVMSPIERDLMFHVRMADDERRMLEALAEQEGVTASDWVRITIRRSFTDRFGGRRPKKKKG